MIIEGEATATNSAIMMNQNEGNETISLNFQILSFLFRASALSEVGCFPSGKSPTSSGLCLINKNIGMERGNAIIQRVRYAALQEKEEEIIVMICKFTDSPAMRLNAVIPIAKLRRSWKKFTATVLGIRFCRLGPAIDLMTI